MRSRLVSTLALLGPAFVVFACATGTDDSLEGVGGAAASGGFGATGGSATGGFGGGGAGGTSASGGGGSGGGVAGMAGAAGAAGGGAGGTSGAGGGGTGGTSGGAGGASGGAGGSGGSGGASGGTGGASGGTGGASGGSGGASGGSGGTGACPGVVVSGTCVYMANKASLQQTAAQTACTGLGTGWNLCPSATLCNPSTIGYLSTAGCNCNNGASGCSCGSTNNLYIHVQGSTSPYYIRTSLVPNCNWASDACTSSVSETCGSALCCK